MPQQDPSESRLAALSEVPGTELRQLRATFDSFREFVERYSPWLSDSCIFVETLASVPVGAPVRLEIHLRGQPVLIRALGQVDWIRTADDAEEGPPGVALNISYLDTASARLIDSIFRLYAGQQSAAMGEEVTENWEMDVESLIDDAFPMGDATAADAVTAARPPAAPKESPPPPAAEAGAVLEEVEMPDLAEMTFEEPEPTAREPEEAVDLPELDLPELDLPELDLPEVTLEIEEPEAPEEKPAEPLAMPAEALAVEEPGVGPPEVGLPEVGLPELTLEIEEPEEAVAMSEVNLEAAEIEVVEEPEVAVEEPSGTFDLSEVEDLEATSEMPEATVEPPPAAPPVTPAASASAFVDRLSAAFTESPAAVEPDAASAFGFGLVEPAAEAEPALPPLEDDEDVAVKPVAPPEPTPAAPAAPAPTVPAPTVPAPTVPAPTVPAPTVPAPAPVMPGPVAPAARPAAAASVAMSSSDRSFLNRSVLVFLVAVVAAGVLFIFLRNRPHTATPPPAGGEASASLPALATPTASPEAAAPASLEPASVAPATAGGEAVTASTATASSGAEPAGATAAPGETVPLAETTIAVTAPPAEPPPAAVPEPPLAAASEPDPTVMAGDVERLIKAWAAAWSAQRPEDYIACYAPDFSPAGLSREDWELQRQARIRAPANLLVQTRDIGVEILDATRARATFFQDYATDDKRLVTWKTMELERLPEGWRIISERAGR